MGLVVEHNNQEIWSPSLRVGNLFLEQVQSLERLIGSESGITSDEADTIAVDGPVLTAFINTVLQRLETTNNGPLVALATGCTELLIALNARITGEWPETSGRLTALVSDAKTVMLAISK